MLKKIKIYLTVMLLLVLFFKTDIVSAVTNKCEYDKKELTVEFDEGGTAKINQSFYEDKKVPYVLNALYNNTSGKIEATESLEFQEKELFGSCPEKLYVCKYEEISSESGLANWFSDEHGVVNMLQKIYIFYSEGEMNQNSTLKDLPNSEVIYGSEMIDSVADGYNACSDYDIPVLNVITGALCSVGNLALTEIKGIWTKENAYIKYKECFNTKYTGDGPSYNLACPNLNIYLGRFNSAINEYKACPENNAACISKTITNVNEKENMIKDYCKSIMQEQDYDGGTEQDCLESCMGIANQTIKAKVAAGILSNNSGDCGLSARLLVWLNNIMRWVKYILPVIVIIFGILDFIKAIGADKEDEMKKAQKKFITRLIAAALVFIIPLIIEFVLEKMGFGYNSCSLF